MKLWHPDIVKITRTELVFFLQFRAQLFRSTVDTELFQDIINIGTKWRHEQFLAQTKMEKINTNSMKELKDCTTGTPIY